LEYENVKLGNELRDVFGASGQLMLKAVVDEDKGSKLRIWRREN
jgi:hypothetical protein